SALPPSQHEQAGVPLAQPNGNRGLGPGRRHFALVDYGVVPGADSVGNDGGRPIEILLLAGKGRGFLYTAGEIREAALPEDRAREPGLNPVAQPGEENPERG